MKVCTRSLPLLSRQPICDKRLNVVGYELLFRPRSDAPLISGGDSATARIVVDALFELGADALVGPNRAFINIPEPFLIDGYCEFLPKDRVVLEILENVRPDAAVIAAMSRLAKAGFTIALDDFVYDESKRPMVELASIIKLDVLALGLSETARHLEILKRYPAKLLAEKVEDYSTFETYTAMGFDWFQGYFFCKPQMVRGRRAPVNKLASTQLWAELQNPNADMRALEAIISKDVTLTYRLLRYVNSASFAFNKRVHSVAHAITLMGLDQVRKLASLVMLAGMDDQPRELIVTAAIRARTCELLGRALGEPPETYFTVGLLSVVDALLGMPLADALALLPLTRSTTLALTEYRGNAGAVLQSVYACERGDWSAISLDESMHSVLRDAYLNGIAWADEIFSSVTSD